RAVVDHGDAGRRDALTDAARKSACFLAIEVALQSVTDRLVQEDARPSIPENDDHRTCRRCACTQIDERLIDRLSRVFIEYRVVEIGVAETAASSREALLAPPVLLDA